MTYVIRNKTVEWYLDSYNNLTWPLEDSESFDDEDKARTFLKTNRHDPEQWQVLDIEQARALEIMAVL